ncbi:hypothetical_protein [Leishmania infantum]|uniref:Hypothetical_protein n=1 Tax=Leishmania infantum TaxID=5671 RepID=A0A6L0XHE5_LEIIN|nr:hypothetical_protein [Leishmania infantum]SUZ42950.1 hypothetical_protein [Leishmania infantum]
MLRTWPPVSDATPTSRENRAARCGTLAHGGSLTAAVPHQKNEDAELTRRPETVLAQLRTGACPHFGFRQRWVAGSDSMELTWCGAFYSARIAVPPPLPGPSSSPSSGSADTGREDQDMQPTRARLSPVVQHASEEGTRKHSSEPVRRAALDWTAGRFVLHDGG